MGEYMLKWSKANAKTHALSNVSAIKPYLANNRKIYSLDMLSGYSCPYALECFSRAVSHDSNGNPLKLSDVPNGGKLQLKIVDGPKTKFRCFSASQENQYPNTFLARKHNFDLMKNQSNSLTMFQELDRSMPKNLGVCRIHVGGDMFNRHYMLAWGMLAEKHNDRLFYAYTKSLEFWIKFRDYIDNLPNLVFTASYGGKFDHLIEPEGLRSAKVVFSKKQAKGLGLEIDHDDSHAADPSKKNKSFALLIHGTQPAGSDASEALKQLKGEGSYRR